MPENTTVSPLIEGEVKPTKAKAVPGTTVVVSAMRTSMTAYDYSGMSAPTDGGNYRMTTYRLAVGLKYNHVRYVGAAKNTIPVP